MRPYSNEYLSLIHIWVLKYMVRALASLTRNIPEAVWAVLLLPLLWYGDFLGFLVLCIDVYKRQS